jgi:hypothetical protein
LDPFTSCALPSAAPAARRTLSVWGAPVELVLMPDRAQRRPRPPALLHRDRAPQILAREALWRSDDPPAVLTPNRFPFARRAAILWSARPQREVDADLLALALALAEPHRGTVLMNTLGAAATQPRAHLHLVGERLDFLAALPTEAVGIAALADGQDDVDLKEALSGVDVVALAPPFPGLVLGLRGARDARARAAARLLARRVSPAANLVGDGATTWFVPRHRETPAPHFAQPLGCAEVWGRFCYEDEAAFAAATAEDLIGAWTAALVPRPW